MSAAGAVLAMVIGVFGTTTIHLSKGMMRLGIKHLRREEVGFGEQKSTSRKRASAIYTTGVLMNFTNPLWVIVANRFAPTVYYTSMYGLGLIALLVFSRIRLRETIDHRQILGVFVIVAGTLIVGVSELLDGAPSLFGASRIRVITIALLWVVAAPILAIMLRGWKIVIQEVFFGITAGGLAALEAVVKGVAQAGAVSNSFLPQTTVNWWLFGLSFFGAAGAFGLIQWSYFRSCRASVMGAAYDVAYVAVPLLIVPYVLGAPTLGFWCFTGLAVLTAGAFLVAAPPRRAA